MLTAHRSAFNRRVEKPVRLFSALFAALTLLACGNDNTENASPPPDGYPLLGSTYKLQLEIVGGECLPAGLVPQSANDITVSVTQIGERVKWMQMTEQGIWNLSGAICPVDDGYELLLSGTSIYRYRSNSQTCEARLIIPTEASTCSNDDLCCADATVAHFTINECSLESTVEAQLLFKKNCANNAPCTLKLHMNAIQTADSPFVPDAGACEPVDAGE